MHFEIQLPPQQGQGLASTLTVEADNWLHALRQALERSTTDAPLSHNLVCDIQPNHVFTVIDANTQRIFHMRGLDAPPEYPVEVNPNPSRFVLPSSDAISNAATMNLSTARKQIGLIPPPTLAKPKTPKPEPLPKPTLAKSKNPKNRDPKPSKGVAGEISSSKNPARPTPAAPRPSAPSMVIDETGVESNVPPPGSTGIQPKPTLKPSTPAKAPTPIPSPKPTPAKQHVTAPPIPKPQPKPIPKPTPSPTPQPTTSAQVADTAIEDVFLDIYDLFDLDMSMTQGIDFVIDLAVRAIRAESGAVLFASPDGSELRFATARGPHAHTMMELTVPIQEGFAGYTTRSGVAVMSSNPSKDPRFYKRIATSTGYVPSSILCSPIEHEGRVYGCIQLLNKHNDLAFDDVDCNALNYIGQQMGRFVYESLSVK